MKKVILILVVLGFYSVKSQAGELVYRDKCTFEAMPFPLVVDSSENNIWQIGIPSKSIFNGAYSSPYSIVTDTINSYPINCNSCFTIIFDQKTISWLYQNNMISFYHKYDTDSSSDGGYIEISYDNGKSWDNVIYDSVGLSPKNNFFHGFNSRGLYNNSDTIKGGIPAFTGTQHNWVYTSMQWEFWAVKKSFIDTVLIRFCFKSDSIEDGREGWIIDDIYLHFNRPTTTEAYTIGQINLSPNPLVDKSLLKPFDDSVDHFRLIILDLTGKVFHDEMVFKNETVLNRIDFLPGCYIVRAISNRGMSSSKLIVK